MSATLKTRRFTLRPARDTDAEFIALYLNDYAVAGNLARVPFPYRLSDARAWLRTLRDHVPPGEANFAIDLPGQGYAGHVGFHPGELGTVIGYWLGAPFWGQGLMTEAVTAATDWFFKSSGADRLYSGVFAFNQASLAIQKKLGFTQTGQSMLLCLARGREVEHIDTILTRAAWMERSK
ncbi:GNAT family N-acetyltransferase [Devosia sp.]|uniref:GNAT family N-acetyltransferase n=1 Tax=Devosia sp. TaxID=1871048 RepID=UPI0032658D7E